MAATNFTPISLYFSATPSAVPTAPNLVAGELALNTNDGKLYFKNSSGVVTLLAGSTSGPAGGSNTQVQYNNSGVLAGITGATTNGTALTLVAPVLGTPASATLTNATGLPISTGVSGLGTNVATALGVNTGTAGAFVVNGGALGSPSSVGTMPAFTLGGTVSGGGNQINNVVIGTTTPLAGAFTTLSATGATTIGPGATLVTINAGASPMLNLLGTNTGTYSSFQRNDEAGYGGRVGAGNTLYGPGAARSLGLDGFSEVNIGIAGTRHFVFTSTALALQSGISLTGGTSGTGYSFSGSAPATSLTLDSSGNLLVGTTSTASGGKVVANGLVYQFQTANGTNATPVLSGGYLIGSDSSTVYAGIRALNSYLSSNASQLAFYVTNTTGGAYEAGRFDPSGNLGIGTASPLSLGAGYTSITVNNATTGGGVVFAAGGVQKGAVFNGGNAVYLDANNAAGVINFRNTSTGATMQFDASGNLGLGITPSAWQTANRQVFQVGKAGGAGFIGYNTSSASTTVGSNCYSTGSSESVWTYVDGSAASLYQAGGAVGHIWSIAPSGTAGNPVTFTQAMTLDSSGNLIIADTTAQYSAKLYVNGSIAARNGGVDGTYQDAFVAGYSSNYTEKNIIQTAVSSTAASSGFKFMVSDGSSLSTTTESFRINRSSCTVIGSLSKGSGSFKIDHPLPEKTNTHHLVHSFIEGPQADLIYRGKVNLVGGTATVNIDTAADMTEGTFVALCRDVQCFTTNESDWTAVRGSVTGNILTIEAQDNTSTANISWMVIGERQDKHMYETGWTDNDGKVIVEPLKS